jgi:hypothetical protein
VQQRSNEEVAKAARNGPGIDAAMRRGVAKALEERRKLGLPIVSSETMKGPPQSNGVHKHK